MKNVFPDMAISMLAIGEETGEMDSMLSKVADFYEDEVATAVKTLTSLIEPAMIVLVGGIVGSILVAMYLPMFSIFDKIRSLLRDYPLLRYFNYNSNSLNDTFRSKGVAALNEYITLKQPLVQKNQAQLPNKEREVA
jgi:predicted NBD/HSP70 family sugar kinase